MTNDQTRRPPWERAVSVPVRMYELGARRIFNLEQPLTRLVDVAPRVLHPLQLEMTLEHLETIDPFQNLGLSRGERAAHRGEEYFHPASTQLTRELRCVVEYPSDRVGSHENTARNEEATHGCDCSSSASGRGLAFCTSLKRRNSPR
jgi:hypothetical protein